MIRSSKTAPARCQKSCAVWCAAMNASTNPTRRWPVMDFVVDRYGEYVLLKPTLTGSILVLWLAGPAMLLLGLGLGAAFLRGRARSVAETEAALSEGEKARLDQILKD